ncbi:putative bifunctional diguanylate cyclase/phosphodiesterase [Hansschlegelia quercus]|nr:EAL domain-containing protein [Hansschlegelia quercus]
MAIILLSTFMLCYTWQEFVDRQLSAALGWVYENLSDRLQLALTSTAFAGASLFIPTVVLLTMFRRLSAAEAETSTLSRRDSLTGLANRRGFSEALQCLCGDPGAHFALVLVDVDNFKPVNDQHGHGAGDVLLCTVAERLSALTPAKGLAARLGGDEFAVLVPDCEDARAASQLAEKMARSLAAPASLHDICIATSASLGVAMRTSASQQAEAILRFADIALYRAKNEERGGFRLFEQRMEDEIEEQRALDLEIRTSIAAGSFVPYFQPLVELNGGRIVGFEILARWRHPRRGLLLPVEFIPAAERLGCVTNLTLGVLRQACEQVKSWTAKPRLAVNISPGELHDRTLALKLMAVLSQTGFPPNRLEVEITEGAVIIDNLARDFVDQLRSVGISVALDDFGTGYSSLSKLQELRFDKIKIDRSFIRRAEHSSESRKLIRMIVALGKTLNVATTAEGVESPEMARLLARKGCTYGQGYHFGKPMPVSEAETLFNASVTPFGMSASERAAGRKTTGHREIGEPENDSSSPPSSLAVAISALQGAGYTVNVCSNPGRIAVDGAELAVDEILAFAAEKTGLPPQAASVA